MSALYQQVLNLLTTPPGNLAYHLVLAFSIAGAFQAAAAPWSRGFAPARRMALGLALLLIAQLALGVNAGLAQVFDRPIALLPALDRAVSAFSLAMVIWLWAFPEPQRLADTATALLGLLAAALFFFTSAWWNNLETAGGFNGSPPDILWSGFVLFLAFLGALLLLNRRPEGYGSGLGMLGLIFAGHLAHWLAPWPEGDFPGAVRLAQMAAYPLLLTLPQRLPALAGAERPAPAAPAFPRAGAADPALARSFRRLLAGSAAPQAYPALAYALCQTLPAELCLVLALQEEPERRAALAGYDAQRGRALENLALEEDRLPALANALRAGQPLRLPAGDEAADLSALAQALELPRSGALLAAPLLGDGLLGIALLSPYSGRNWGEEEQERLLELAGALADFLGRTRRAAEMEEQLALAREDARLAENREEEARRKGEGLLLQLAVLQEQVSQERARAESLAALVGAQEEAQDALLRLQSENERLNRALGATARDEKTHPLEVERLQGELRLALEEIARLRGELGESERAPGAPEAARAEVAWPAERAEALVSFASQARQPLAAILGYTGLLLEEPAERVGAAARRHLERIQAAAERLSGLAELLLQGAPEAEAAGLSPQPLEAGALIQAAAGEAAELLRRRNVRLRLEVPDSLPPPAGDGEALQQALRQLLRNAITATPPEGEVLLQAGLLQGAGQPDRLLIRLTDRGGGIPPEERSRVFARPTGGQAAPIPGLGENPSSLPAARHLVEAQGGRLLLESQVGQGSTFSLLLPIAAPTSPRSPAA